MARRRHHVSLYFTIADGRAVVAAPTFFGSNPAEVREGPKQACARSIASRTPAALLVMSLDDAQKKAAILADAAPNDILTKTEVVVSPLSPMGWSHRR